MKVPLASVGLRNKDLKAIEETLDSGNLTMGSRVKRFESEMANYLGFSHFVMVNSGSSANLAIFEALLRPAIGVPKLMPGDEVLVPAIAWPTTVWPIVQLGLKPVFVDVDEKTLAIDLVQAENLIRLTQNKIKAIFVIHPLGFCVDEMLLKDFCKTYKLIYLSDTCESLGAFRNGSHAGKEAVAASFSFYFSHHLTTMEGGGIATDDEEFADDLKSIRSHGWSRERSDSTSWVTGAIATDSKFTFVSTGYNLRPMEIQGAIGSSQLEDLPQFLSRRREIAFAVKEAIKNGPLTLIEGDAVDTLNSSLHSRMLICLKTERSQASPIRAKLEELGVETRPPLTGNFLSQPAAHKILSSRFDASTFTKAEQITKTSFLIGCHHEYSDAQINYLCEKLKGID